MKIFTIILFLCFSASADFSQNKADKIFQSIENGINAADVSQFTSFIKEKTYISLLSGYSDYFSPNQAHYVLQDFLNFYEPIEFKFDNKVFNDDYSFATGVLKYFHRGSKKNSRVFVALKKVKDLWEISQLTIN